MVSSRSIQLTHAFRIQQNWSNLQPRQQRRCHSWASFFHEINQVGMRSHCHYEFGTVIMGQQHGQIFAGSRSRNGMEGQTEPI